MSKKNKKREIQNQGHKRRQTVFKNIAIVIILCFLVAGTALFKAEKIKRNDKQNER